MLAMNCHVLGGSASTLPQNKRDYHQNKHGHPSANRRPHASITRVAVMIQSLT